MSTGLVPLKAAAPYSTPCQFVCNGNWFAGQTHLDFQTALFFGQRFDMNVARRVLCDLHLVSC